MRRYFVALPLVAAVALLVALSPDRQVASAQPKKGKTPDEEAIAQVQLAEKGMKVDVWAAAPLMMNPVSFCFGEKGRVFVAETTRFDHGVPDTRGHMKWLDEDLANRTTDDLLAMILLFVLAAGWTTEALGVHALFGAFLAGVVMPRHEGLMREVSSKIEPLTVGLLLPIYFAFTGLRTSFSLISGTQLWFYCAVVIALAVAGKLGGSMLAMKFNGMSWRESAAVGILMNTRGLVELVILNIGLDLGVLSPSLFSIMVLMALATTLMTTPLLALIWRGERQEESSDKENRAEEEPRPVQSND